MKKGRWRTQPQCPECASQRLYRDGLRYLADGSTVQRLLCRECSYRFSLGSRRSNKHKHVQKSHSSALNSAAHYLVSSQICVTETIGAKNLAKVEPLKDGLAGATVIRNEADVKGKIVEFTW